MSDPAGIGTAPGSDALAAFLAAVASQPAPRVLELGTLRWEANRPSHHQVWVPHAGEYTMSDIAAGTDVDVVADAHDLAPFADGSFDAVIAVSVWEHLDRPWLAAAAVARVMGANAVAYIGTHQSFPIHGYPQDRWRFTREALALIFADAGLEGIVTGYQYPCKITPPREVTRWNPAAEAYLNVDLFARRP